MDCPYCGGEMRVIDTLKYEGYPVDKAGVGYEWERLRLYECVECGFRVKTSEVAIAIGVHYKTLRS